MEGNMIKIKKKDGSTEVFSGDKIVRAVMKSADRAMVQLTEEQKIEIVDSVFNAIQFSNQPVQVETVHYAVERALNRVNPAIAKCYMDYRNYKKDFVGMLDSVYQKSQSIRYLGDRDNANTDSALVPTQRSLIYNELSSALYKKFFLNREEREAMKDGYIYIHDRSARLDTMNCCLFDMANVLSGGFEMGNVWYNEPKTLDVAFDVISDVAISAAACQYGGFTIPECDKLLAPYAKKSYDKYYQEYMDIHDKIYLSQANMLECEASVEANIYAMKKVRRDMDQGFQSWEYRFNTVGSSRGDYPFIAISFGLADDVFGQMATESCLAVRAGGQGADGHKKPVLFPKLTFLYDENLHGKGKKLEHLFDCAIDCSSKAMYPKKIGA